MDCGVDVNDKENDGKSDQFIFVQYWYFNCKSLDNLSFSNANPGIRISLGFKFPFTHSLKKLIIEVMLI